MIKRIVSFFLIVIALIGATLTLLMVTMPNPKQITECMVTEMYKVDLCEKNGKYARINSISKYLKDVVVISEDSSFYHHNGFDWFEIQNSMRENWQDLSYSRGGSTITQQLAKNVFLSSNKSLTRKLREAYLAFQIEQILPKPKILEKYLNVVEFGKDLYGVKSAANHYFGKSPSELNLLESAFLAYLLPNPKVYSRIYTKGALTHFSRYRLLDLCYKMYRYGRISEDQYQAAKEYVNLFPWKGLDGSQLARLNGQSDDFQPPATEEIPELEMPMAETKVAPPTANDQVKKEIEALEEDSAFDNETIPPAEIHSTAFGLGTPPETKEDPPQQESETFDN